MTSPICPAAHLLRRSELPLRESTKFHSNLAAANPSLHCVSPSLSLGREGPDASETASHFHLRKPQPYRVPRNSFLAHPPAAYRTFPLLLDSQIKSLPAFPITRCLRADSPRGCGIASRWLVIILPLASALSRRVFRPARGAAHRSQLMRRKIGQFGCLRSS